MIEWKVIREFPNYSVSNCGEVRNNKTGRILKPEIMRKGYLRVKLHDGKRWKKVLIHRLVLVCFIGECPEKYEANHKDGNKANNCIDNLEWITSSENAYHAYKLGLRVAPSRMGEDIGNAKLTEGNVKSIRFIYKNFKTTHEKLSNFFEVDRKHIGNVINRKCWKHI